jgi:4-amino-4-deoxy-L-arabinose transferase-like glycosyltransferase
MRITLPRAFSSQAGTRVLRSFGESHLEQIALSGMVILAAVLRFANLKALGYGNHYYTAAVVAMLESWHNFFFAAAEPGGSVTIDKPPVGLWLQAISAKIFGVSGFSVLLPQLVAGVLSVIVVYYLVRRSFGAVAGLLAGLTLAITPVVIATDRNNTMDSTLILTLLLAAWAFIKATESGRLRYLLLGAVLVGIGFNIKMLEAYLPLPAFYALYLLGSNERLWRKVGKLALASVLLLIISFSWAVAVDLTPPDQRPYVGSSGDNSEMSLIIGYNGVDRLLGMMGRRSMFSSSGGPGGGFPGQGRTQNGNLPQPPANRSEAPQFPSNGTDNPQFPQDGAFGGFAPNGPGGDNHSFQPDNSPNRQAGDGGYFPRQDSGGGARGGGGAFGGIGQAGPLRLFTPPLSKEVSWLLPFGLVSLLILLFSARLRWPLDLQHQALVLWGGWLVTEAAFFSIAGFFHEYYLSMLAPPLAALVGIGVVLLWRWRQSRPWQASLLLLLAAGGTLLFQVYTARAFVQNLSWLPLVLGLFIGGALLLVGAALRSAYRPAALAGSTCLAAAILLTPGVWSALTTLNAGGMMALPSAYSGSSPGFGGGRDGIQVNQALLDYLETNTEGMRYMLAVSSAQQGADYVIASGRGVLYMGGFSGQDQVVTQTDLATLVERGDLRYIVVDGGGRDPRENANISNWVTSTCNPVQDVVANGFPSGQSDNRSQDGQGGGFQVDMQAGGPLYDCAGLQSGG